MSGRRNKNRGGAVVGNQEEINLWNSINEEIKALLPLINKNTDDMNAIKDTDGKRARANEKSPEYQEQTKSLDGMFRNGVKSSEAAVARINQLKEQLNILIGLKKSSEQEAQSLQSHGGGLGSSSSLGGSGALSSRGGSGLSSGSGRGAAGRASTSREKKTESVPSEKERDKEREKGKEKEHDRDMYEFDGAGDSPVPSPMSSHTKKMGSANGGNGGSGNGSGNGSGAVGGTGSDRSGGNRDSLPPRAGTGERETPGKADSVPPESGGGGSATASQRAKVSFIKGQEVVFRPKPSAQNEQPDWVLGRVQQVLGEGKSRRYKVQDADPDLPPEQRSEFRTSASSMIPIPPEGTELPPLEVGKTVLAEYPDSTTFYKAEVMGTEPETGKIRLKFAGEENIDTLQLVERRLVVEFRS